MYVCVCSQVTDHQIRDAVVDGVTSMNELGDRLGVAQCCGTCDWQAREILENTLSEHAVMALASDAAA